MTDVLKHRFVSPKLDGTDTQQIQPSHWNDGHRFTGGNLDDFLRRDPTDATFGAKWVADQGWFAYTPQLWIGGALISVLGNHTIAGRWFRRANFVAFEIVFSVGSDPIPAGAWQFGLPVATAGALSPGSGLLTNAGTGTHYPLFAHSYGVGDRLTVLYMGASPAAANLTSTAPIALGAFMYLEIRGTFVAA